MESLQDRIGVALAWCEVEHERDSYELRDPEHSDRVYATLRWPSSRSWHAVTETAEGDWSFDWRGVLHQRVVIRRAPRDPEQATAQIDAPLAEMPISGWRYGGTVRLPSGRSYTWKNMGGWGSNWVFTDDNGLVVLQAYLKWHWKRTEMSVTIPPDIRPAADISLLAVRAVYLLVSDTEDMQVAAGMG
jgi:hypothetical protein